MASLGVLIGCMTAIDPANCFSLLQLKAQLSKEIKKKTRINAVNKDPNNKIQLDTTLERSRLKNRAAQDRGQHRTRPKGAFSVPSVKTLVRCKFKWK